jgi:5-methyltetrahydropteroyltriglutamate--homocysteine methyltransferase
VDVGLLTTTAGWLPRPEALREARRAFDDGDLGEDALRQAEIAAAGEAIHLQESLGLDVVTDGQMERNDGVSWFASRLAGVESGGAVRCFGQHYASKPRIVGEIARQEPIAVATWSAARGIAARPLKAILTGPYTLMDGSFDEHYGSRERLCLAFAETVRAEAEDLVQAGVSEIEIAEPALPARAEELDFAEAALAHVTAGLRGRARTWTRLGYADLLPVLDRVLNLPVDGVMLEMAHSRFETLPGLAALPAGKLLAAGVVDVLDARVESTAEIQSRIERLLTRVPGERLWIAPDAGLRALDPAIARAKLRAVVEAAALFG